MARRDDNSTLQTRGTLADRALSRVTGAILIPGNRVRLLRDAQENYPAWLEAIDRAERHIHFENFIFHEDEVGLQFADAFIAKAREGVRVRLIYDWLGTFLSASRGFWKRLRSSGIEVRCYNPPRLDSPIGWLSRDHRKILIVDGRIGFVAGLCVGKMWVGDAEKKIPPWRDTGVEVRGPAVAEIERAFRHTWASLGNRIPVEEPGDDSEFAAVGNTDVRIVASLPGTVGMIRTDLFIAALARERLWLSDAYYAGTPSYVQALRAAARDDVDVRLLVPNSTDLPVLRPLSRAGYRALLEAGVRVFEWNGPMMHAKTAVADGLWARVGSTNLNLASWFGNCELDAIVEDEAFAHDMEEMYLQDLMNSTEVVLDEKQKVRAPGRPLIHGRKSRGSGGTARRAAAGAIRLTNALGAAFTNRRVLEPVESRYMASAGVLLLALAVVFGFFPPVLIYPTIVVFVWIALSLLYRAYKLRREREKRSRSG